MRRLADLHNDVLTEASENTAKTLASASKIVLAVWTTELSDPLAFLKNQKNEGIYRAIEDLGFVERCGMYESMRVIREFAPVYASLTWNHANALAGGASSDGGLTDFGREVISRLEAAAITLDTAHLNRKSFFQVAEASTKPFICSHTCFDGVYKHSRNLTDGQIKAVLDSCGLVGFTLVSEFLGKEQASVRDVLRQIEYFCGKFGHKGLALGTDFYGTKKPAIKTYRGIGGLVEAMLRRGFTSEQVDRILYKNAADFLAAAKE